jgi:hypothetical protein
MSQLPRTPIPLVREARTRLSEPPSECPPPRSPHEPCSAAAARSPPPRDPNLIAVRHVRAGGRLVPVELLQNEGGSVAARFLIGSADTPIIDAPSAAEVLATAEEVIEGVLFARRDEPA